MKGSHRPFFVWPGRLVNFLTFKKGIDFFQKMSIIIIVKGGDRGTETTVWKAETLCF